MANTASRVIVSEVEARIKALTVKYLSLQCSMCTSQLNITVTGYRRANGRSVWLDSSELYVRKIRSQLYRTQQTNYCWCVRYGGS